MFFYSVTSKIFFCIELQCLGLVVEILACKTMLNMRWILSIPSCLYLYIKKLITSIDRNEPMKINRTKYKIILKFKTFP